MAALAFYIFVLPLSYLPMGFSYLLADLFYLILITVFPYRKKIIDGNLKRSFPGLTPTEILKLKRRFYRHFSDILIEGIKNLSISKRELKRRFTAKNPELMQELYAKNKSVILVSGHYNNWEWLITSQSFLFPHKAYGIGMPMSSKFWDKKINSLRQRFGMKVINSGNFKEAIEESDEPIAILTLADQSPGDSNKSYWMNFLNQQSAILYGPEYMAIKYNMAVVGFIIRKVKRGHYEMELKLICDDPIKTKWGEITEEHIKMLETAIIEKPEQWIWSHKRWKRDLPTDMDKLRQEQYEKFKQLANR